MADRVPSYVVIEVAEDVRDYTAFDLLQAVHILARINQHEVDEPLIDGIEYRSCFASALLVVAGELRGRYRELDNDKRPALQRLLNDDL